MWNWAESVVEITYAVRVAFAHVLTLHDKPDFAFVEVPIFPLNFVVKPSAEYLVFR